MSNWKSLRVGARAAVILTAVVLSVAGWSAPAAAQLGNMLFFAIAEADNNSNETITQRGTNYVVVKDENDSTYTVTAWFAGSNQNITVMAGLLFPPYVLASPDGTLWVTGSVQGTRFVTHITANVDTHNPTLTNINVPALKPGSSIGTATVDRQGNLWLSVGDNSGNASIVEVTASGQVNGSSARATASAHPPSPPQTPVTCSSATGGTPFQIPTPAGAAFPPDALNLTLGPDGNIWFTETPAYDSNHNPITNNGNEMIGCINASGIISQYPVPTHFAGTGSRNTTTGTYIAAGSDGNVWFIESTAGAVAKITPSGQITEYPLGLGIGGLMGLALGGDGNIWVRSLFFNQNGFVTTISRVTPSGAIKNFINPTQNGGSDVELVLGPDRALWYPEDENIGRINTAGAIVEFPLPTPTVNGQPNYSFQLVFNPSGMGSLLEFTSSDLVTFRIALANSHDVSGDGFSDIAWHDGNGNTAAWLMNGAQVTQAAALGNVAGAWSIVAQHDFDGDGKADWLWRDAGGDLALWFLNGAQVAAVASLGNVAPNWVVSGTGDLNGDGIGDILWRDSSSGAVVAWFMNGAQVASTASFGTVGGTWTILGDGNGGVLWRDAAGNLALWAIQAGQIAGISTFAAPPANWVVQGVGDFNGDGATDILWRDSNTGTVAIWFLSLGGGVQSVASLGAVPPSAWSIAQIGDYNGDGFSDILWTDTAGNLATWFMSNGAVSSVASLGSVGGSWQVQNANAQ